MARPAGWVSAEYQMPKPNWAYQIDEPLHLADVEALVLDGSSERDFLSDLAAAAR